MSDECSRCKGPVPTLDNFRETSFFGLVETKVSTVVTHTVRLRALYTNERPRFGGSKVGTANEERPLCSDCWSLLLGRFFGGRDVPALPGREGL